MTSLPGSAPEGARGWSRDNVPCEPGWYWLKVATIYPLLLNEDGLWDPGQRSTADLLNCGVQFGPRIPSPEALGRMQEFIESIIATEELYPALAAEARAALKETDR